MMSSTYELGLVIPTNEPEVAFRYLLKSLESLKGLSGRIVLLFNFQKPWTLEQVESACNMCRSCGLDVIHTYSEYEIKGPGEIPIVKIRHDTAELADCKYYMFVDDDFSFRPESATQLSFVLQYLNEHPGCGTVLLKGKDKESGVKDFTIRPCRNFRIRCITDKGIILRKIRGGILFPDDALSLVGSDEEKIAVSWRIHEGYYPAVAYNTKIRHYENSRSNQQESRAVPGSVMYRWNKKSILRDNVNKFIKENFYPEFNNRGGVPTVLYDMSEFVRKTGVHVDTLDEIVMKEVN